MLRSCVDNAFTIKILNRFWLQIELLRQLKIFLFLVTAFGHIKYNLEWRAHENHCCKDVFILFQWFLKRRLKG